MDKKIEELRAEIRKAEEEGKAFRPKSRDEKICRFCGEPFVPKSKRGKQVFCSDRCRIRYWSKRTRELGYRPRPQTKRICSECGREFIARCHNTNACSEECGKLRFKRLSDEKRERESRQFYSKGKVWVLDMETWEWIEEDRGN